jgi:hypothetical protein
VLARYSSAVLTESSATPGHDCLGVFPRRHALRHHAAPTAMPSVSRHDGMKSMDHQRVATRFMASTR